MKKKYLYSIVFLLSVLKGYTQDAVFSQYYASSLYLNPALVGVEPTPTLNVNSRQQWKGVGKAFSTSQLSLIVPLKDGGVLNENIGGVGLTVLTDNMGDGNLKTTGIFASGAYVLRLTHQNHLLFGVQGGIMSRTLDLQNFQWNSQFNDQIGWDNSIDPGNQNLNDNINLVDISAGIFYYNTLKDEIYQDGRGLYLGFSAYHLNQPENSLIEGNNSSLPMLLKAHGGVGIPLKKKIVISPNFLVASQNNLLQINLGTYLDYELSKPVTGLVPTNAYLGVWYRYQDSFIASLGLGNNSYTLGFSYDMNVSALSNSLQGNSAYEISLKLRKPPKKAIVYHQPRV